MPSSGGFCCASHLIPTTGVCASLGARCSLPLHGLVSQSAGEVWYAVSVMSGLMLFGLAVFLFFFGLLPYWFKLHKHLREILGCK